MREGKITIEPEGFKAYGAPMGQLAEGQEFRMEYQGQMRTFVYRDGKAFLVKDA